MLASMAEQRECLQRLTETHVVGEDAAEAVVVQRSQPAETLLLVRAQLGVHLGGHRLVEEHAHLAQRGHRTLPVGGLTAQLTQLGQLVPDAGLEPAHPQHARRAVGERARFSDQFAQLPKLRPLQGEVDTAGQDQELLVPGERDEERFEVDLLAAHLDAN